MDDHGNLSPHAPRLRHARSSLHAAANVERERRCCPFKDMPLGGSPATARNDYALACNEVTSVCSNFFISICSCAIRSMFCSMRDIRYSIEPTCSWRECKISSAYFTIFPSMLLRQGMMQHSVPYLVLRSSNPSTSSFLSCTTNSPISTSCAYRGTSDDTMMAFDWFGLTAMYFSG
uniref:Uncharacterized protein n=1 Tax=Anopheles coluzzii TaxID=1518534 RepID=A0A8W7Q352_ANOCL